MSFEDELNECKDDDKERAKELRSFIVKDKEAIKNAEKTEVSPYYACNQLYITEHNLN